LRIAPQVGQERLPMTRIGAVLPWPEFG